MNISNGNAILELIKRNGKITVTTVHKVIHNLLGEIRKLFKSKTYFQRFKMGNENVLMENLLKQKKMKNILLIN